MSQTIPRSYSDKFVAGMSDYDLLKNKNVDWISGKGTLFAYLLMVLLVWFVLHLSRLFPPEDCWTATNVIHGVVSVFVCYSSANFYCDR